MYADETGDLNMTGAKGASTYFGFGTAVFPNSHGQQLWEGLLLRCHLEEQGIRLPKGLHAKDDSWSTRDEVYDLIRRQAPRFDTTFLLKAKAYADVKRAGPVYLYKLAWFLHFKEIVRQVSAPGDTVFVIAGSLQTNNKRAAIRTALEDVCRQAAGNRTIVPCIWEAASSWGIQVADYALWATQRTLEGRVCPWFSSSVQTTLRSQFMPWGRT